MNGLKKRIDLINLISNCSKQITNSKLQIPENPLPLLSLVTGYFLGQSIRSIRNLVDSLLKIHFHFPNNIVNLCVRLHDIIVRAQFFSARNI